MSSHTHTGHILRLTDIANALRSKRDEPCAITLEEMAEDDTDVYVMKEDANTMLFASGTFAIIAAVFTSISFRRLFPSPTVQLVRQLTAAQDPSGSVVTISTNEPGPSISAYITNGLWILSLFLFLCSAGGAALLKAWIAKYVRQNLCCRYRVERFRTLFTYRHINGNQDEDDPAVVSLDTAAVSIVNFFNAGSIFFILGFIAFLYTVSFTFATVTSLVTLTAVSAYFRLRTPPLENKNYPGPFYTPLAARLFKTNEFRLKTPGHTEPILPQ